MRWKDWNERDEFKKNLKDLLPKGCLWKLVGTVADWRRGSGRFLAGLCQAEMSNLSNFNLSGEGQNQKRRITRR